MRLSEHMKDAVEAMDAVLKAPDSDLSNKTDSLSMQEFDRMCRTYSENSNSPQVKYLTRSSKLNLVPQSILVSHLWGVETEIDLTGRR